MKAMVLDRIARVEEEPLKLEEVSTPNPGFKQVLIRVYACGICRTELDEIEGRLKCRIPVILGHQVVGRVVELGPGATKYDVGDRVGVEWIYHACGECYFCRRGNENLCYGFIGTGCDVDGGYAEYMIAYEDFTYQIPEVFRILKLHHYFVVEL